MRWDVGIGKLGTRFALRPAMSSVEAPTVARARELMRAHFGFAHLYRGQIAALTSLFENRDTLAILPTGGGKSLIYQLAGLLLPGPTVVVSPLLALQQDQVETFNARGIARAALLNSTLSVNQHDEVWRDLEAGEIKFLLLAPEQLANPETLARLRACEPSLLVIDEAHCVSQWGHDFRPDYGRLGHARLELGAPTTLALTATAAPPVRAAIVESLGLQEPNVVVTGFDRPNVALEVRSYADDHAKTRAALEAVADGPKPAILYAATRAQTQELADKLCARGVRATVYHAGLSASEREEHQRAWMESDDGVIVATIAFGMGVDKPDVRAVWHHDVPGSLDAYNQEAGRAGRDGRRARATLFYCAADVGLRRFQAGGGGGDAQTATQIAAVIADMNENDEAASLPLLQNSLDLPNGAIKKNLAHLESVGAVEVSGGGALEVAPELSFKQIKKALKTRDENERDWDKSRVEMMRAYAEEKGCRRQFLLAYFGEELPEPCGNCDNCGHPKTKPETPNSSDDTPFAVGARVEHRSWGEGQVLRYDGDKVVVVFDEAGYKTLALELVREGDLLRVV